MIKNHVVAKDGFEPPIARSELAVLPLHHMAFLKLPIFTDWQRIYSLLNFLIMKSFLFQ